MTIRRLLVANRGEIAVRVARTAAEMGIHTVGVHGADDADGPHLRRMDAVVALPGSGPAAYLDGPALVAAARGAGCDAVHPGYGFLSESAAFARQCAAAGLVFVGPSPDALELFGDKTRARDLAQRLDVPVAPGCPAPVTVAQAVDFLAAHPGGVMVKALAGGGGRGVRPLGRADDPAAVLRQCSAEAGSAFGDERLYLEARLTDCRHVEIQVAGDGLRAVALGHRDCSLQRQRQKLVEIAPAPALGDAAAEAMTDHALAMALTAGLRGLATFEFLVPCSPGSGGDCVFIEANPRLQVEHTVTEAVLGIDLVALQLRLAEGASLAEAGLDPGWRAQPRGTALQLRVNAERPGPGGVPLPAGGVLQVFELPGGPGVRCDTVGHAGAPVSARFDALLAKLVVHVPDGGFGAALARARRALAELRVEGVATNAALLQAVLAHPGLAAGVVSTTFVETDVLPGLPSVPEPDGAEFERAMAGDAVTSPVHGTLVTWEVTAGAEVYAGQLLGLVEAMKMQYPVVAPVSGRLVGLAAAPGERVAEGQPLCRLEPAAAAGASAAVAGAVDLDALRPELAEVLARRGALLDEARPEPVARRRRSGGRTARENIDRLCDPGSFREVGGLAVAAQRSRRSLEELVARTPADGMVAGTGRVNGALFGDDAATCMVFAYDYTVMAGTQGTRNHQKKDRVFELAARHRWPVVAFAEGGGGRPGDVDLDSAGSLHLPAFTRFAQLSGKVPLVGVVSGRCFAGNAVLAGCCDVIIATASTTLGMGGPAMIEGGGLGRFRPEEVGPVAVHRASGAVDIEVADEDAAVDAARRYLAFFQGDLAPGPAPDGRRLRHAVPANRLRAYDVHTVLDALVDEGSVLELRPGFARNLVTALARLEGRPVGVLANNPGHLGGAVDAAAADKGARFLQLCDAFGLPVVSLVDTPGHMVGPEAEKTGLVRHCSRLFVTGANLRVPVVAVVLRKAYGLGAQAMVGGGFHQPLLSLAWPTAEFGPMNLEGAVRLGWRHELEAAADEQARADLFQRLLAAAYERGSALNAAMLFEVDDVIDPADTRDRLAQALRSARRTGAVWRDPARAARPWLDTW